MVLLSALGACASGLVTIGSLIARRSKINNLIKDGRIIKETVERVKTVKISYLNEKKAYPFYFALTVPGIAWPPTPYRQKNRYTLMNAITISNEKNIGSYSIPDASIPPERIIYLKCPYNQRIFSDEQDDKVRQELEKFVSTNTGLSDGDFLVECYDSHVGNSRTVYFIPEGAIKPTWIYPFINSQIYSNNKEKLLANYLDYSFLTYAAGTSTAILTVYSVF